MRDIEPKIPTWTQGPFELIRHADGHFRLGGDTDRRIALIGFDNALEVCIDTFITLHPKLRDGLEISKDEVERTKRNYHTKIEFLDKYVTAKVIHLVLPIKDILWYHQLRNELYHSGNGLVPERYVIEGARAAVLLVFNALFKVEISLLLDKKSTDSRVAIAGKPRKDSDMIRDYLQQNDPTMVFQEKKNKNRFVEVVALPDGRYGFQVLELIRNTLLEITSYVINENTLEGVEKRLAKGFVPYTGPLPP